MAVITTADVRAFIVRRQATKASNGEINRELTALKKLFSLAIQAGKFLGKPYVPMLKEYNVRVGFFERDQFDTLLKRSRAGYSPYAREEVQADPAKSLPLFAVCLRGHASPATVP